MSPARLDHRFACGDNGASDAPLSPTRGRSAALTTSQDDTEKSDTEHCHGGGFRHLDVGPHVILVNTCVFCQLPVASFRNCPQVNGCGGPQHRGAIGRDSSRRFFPASSTSWSRDSPAMATTCAASLNSSTPVGVPGVRSRLLAPPSYTLANPRVLFAFTIPQPARPDLGRTTVAKFLRVVASRVQWSAQSRISDTRRSSRSDRR